MSIGEGIEVSIDGLTVAKEGPEPTGTGTGHPQLAVNSQQQFVLQASGSYGLWLYSIQSQHWVKLLSGASNGDAGHNYYAVSVSEDGTNFCAADGSGKRIYLVSNPTLSQVQPGDPDQTKQLVAGTGDGTFTPLPLFW